jgi:hypothetical protein
MRGLPVGRVAKTLFVRYISHQYISQSPSEIICCSD